MTAIQAHPQAERLDLAVLYVEVRGFTRISAILEPGIVMTRISEFLAMVTAAVDRHEGVVRGVLNDNLLATFAGVTNAMNAVKCAQEIQRNFTPIAEAWQRDYGLLAAVAMGVHRGEVVVGPLPNKPPARPIAIGDGISMAERLLHRARTGESVLSKAVMDALDVAALTIDIVKLPALNVPNREPLEIYAIVVDTRLDFT